MTHFVAKILTKDLWQTPQDVFNALDREFGFTLDACASDTNKLCSEFMSESHSSLTHEWDTLGAVFCNPPYSATQVFLERCAQQANKHNLTVVALVNANTDTKWFKRAYDTASEIRLITGRLAFVSPSGGKAQGNTKGQCIIIWNGGSECKITLVDRESLK